MSGIVSQRNESNGLVSLQSLKHPEKCLCPPVISSPTHCVYFQLPIVSGVCPRPPEKNDEEWNSNYVVLPHCKRNRVKVGDGKLVPRWPLIQNALKTQISNSKELERVIFSYSGLPNQRCQNFKCLHSFFSQVMDEADSSYFFQSLLPQIISLALKIEDLFPAPCPVLKQQNTFSLSLTQQQIASILANAFLCTFPFYHPSSLPSINCDRLFQTGRVGFQKLKCLINYFRRITTSVADGVVTFTRRHIPYNKLPDWSMSYKLLCDMYVSSDGTIEEEGSSLLEIDFANRFIGGGVLGWGCVQEEIKFLIFPELIASRLFMEQLNNTEAVIVSGCERFNQYSGYAESFKWCGDYTDRTPRDDYGRRRSITVAIDALHFKEKEEQYKINLISRELNKAYAGFSFGQEEGYLTNIATGNWGCGVYNGDPILKLIIQLIAASQCNRHVAYFTFHEEQLKDEIVQLYMFLRQKEAKLCDLWFALKHYEDFTSRNGPTPLSTYILKCFEEGIELMKVDRCDARENTVENEKEPSNSDASSSVKVSDTNKMQDSLVDEVNTNLADVSFSSGSDSEMVDISNLTTKKLSEPVKASTYFLNSEDGREMCLAENKQQWAACRLMKEKVMTSESEPVRKKKKITDYLVKLPKNK